MRRAVLVSAAIVALPLLEGGPALTMPPYRAAGYELVSRFTTFYPPGQPRVINISRAAQILDGTVLRPGGRFSMNQALGKRTRARGFVAAPSISGPIHIDSVGGGVSQVATTLYNAAFFAGLRVGRAHPSLVLHQPLPEGTRSDDLVGWPRARLPE
jgi:vancomycin resistance protein YoaR